MIEVILFWSIGTGLALTVLCFGLRAIIFDYKNKQRINCRQAIKKKKPLKHIVSIMESIFTDSKYGYLYMKRDLSKNKKHLFKPIPKKVTLDIPKMQGPIDSPDVYTPENCINCKNRWFNGFTDRISWCSASRRACEKTIGKPSCQKIPGDPTLGKNPPWLHNVPAIEEEWD